MCVCLCVRARVCGCVRVSLVRPGDSREWSVVKKHYSTMD